MDLTPEQCYERALKLIDKGKPDKAIKLLQIAMLRAPEEVRYREALAVARQKKANPTTPTNLEQASAEELYQRAVQLQQSGESSRANRLMKLAAAKAPDEAKYKEALETARRPPAPHSDLDERITRALHMSNFNEVESLLRQSLREQRAQPERLQLLALLLLRIREDAKAALGPIRESVRLTPKRLSSLLLLEEVLRALGDRAEAARTAQTIREITTDKERLEKARRKLNEKIPAPQSRSTASAGASQQSANTKPALFIALGLALVLAAGVWYMRQPDLVDTSPYTNQLSIVSAISPVPTELILRVEEADWRALGREKQESSLRDVMSTASKEGFQAVFIHTKQDRLLGSARGSDLYITKE